MLFLARFGLMVCACGCYGILRAAWVLGVL